MDLSRFHGVFLAESREQLDILESALLSAQRSGDGSPDRTDIGAIFRAAHSIKGGSSTFGFSEMARVTHVMETQLDDVRRGTRRLDPGLTEALLQATDFLRARIRVRESGVEDIDENAVESVLSTLEAQAGTVDRLQNLEAAMSVPAASRRWDIRFSPHPDLMRRGNDPGRLLAELAAMGDLQIAADLDRLPEWDAFDPEACFLQWHLLLTGEVDREEIENLFDWVADDCDLDIVPLPDPVRPAADEALDDGGIDEDSRISTIRVEKSRIDELIDLVGEMIVRQSGFNRGARVGHTLTDGDVDRIRAMTDRVDQLRDRAIGMRMVPLQLALGRLPRLVHELAKRLDKQISLALEGEFIEADFAVVEALTSPLVHLVRNAIDHGIESPDQRRQKGKSPTGTIRVAGRQDSGNLVVTVADDGRGLDREQLVSRARARGIDVGNLADSLNLIFHPGFSTADEVTDVSGRGVGLDVVKREVQRAGGQVSVSTEPGDGTRFTLVVPLTMSIIDGLLFRVGQQRYVMPALSVIESCELSEARIERVQGGTRLLRHGGEMINLMNVDERQREPAPGSRSRQIAVVVDAGVRRIAIVADEIIAHIQALVKPLDGGLFATTGLAGATVLDDGTLALILDAAGLARLYQSDLRETRRDQPIDA